MNAIYEEQVKFVASNEYSSAIDAIVRKFDESIEQEYWVEVLEAIQEKLLVIAKEGLKNAEMEYKEKLERMNVLKSNVEQLHNGKG